MEPMSEWSKREVTPAQAHWLRRWVERFKLQNRITPLAFDGNTVKCKRYVGCIPLPGGEVLEILPKLDKDTGDPNLIRDRLLYMLAGAGLLPSYRHEQVSLRHTHLGSLLECFIRAFAEDTLALLRRGLVHDYRETEDELPCLRGRLMLAEQLRLEARCVPRFAVRYHEFTHDTLPHRIIKDVVGICRRAAIGMETQRLLFHLLAILDEVSDQRYCRADVDRCLRKLDRRTQAYRPVLQFCKLFLREDSPDPAAGGSEELPAILFNMDRVFEQYIGQMFRRICPGKAFLQGKGEGGSRYLLDKSILRLCPDVWLPDKGETVVDTKWKWLEPKGRQHSEEEMEDEDAVEKIDVPNIKCKIPAPDLHQMHSYASVFKAKRVILLYPCIDDPKSGIAGTFTGTGTDTGTECKLQIAWVNLAVGEGREGFESNVRRQLNELLK